MKSRTVIRYNKSTKQMLLRIFKSIPGFKISSLEVALCPDHLEILKDQVEGALEVLREFDRTEMHQTEPKEGTDTK